MKTKFRNFCFLLSVLLCFLFSFGACSSSENHFQNDSETTKEYIEGKEVVSAEEVNAFNENAIRLFGRTYTTSKGLALENASTGAEICFFGTNLTANIIAASVTMFCRVFIDGDPEGAFLKIGGNDEYKLAKDLSEGVHTVKIIKSTSSQNGKIVIENFSTDGKFLRSETSSSLRMEFVGDSITVGAGVFGKSGQACSAENSDVTKSYAYLTAQALGAYCSVVATEGICVKAKDALPYVNMCEMYQNVSSVTPNPYPQEEPYDIVIVGLGQNDGWYMDSHPEYTTDRFATDYRELLNQIRNRNKDAKIVCVYGMMGVNEKIEAGIQQAVKSQQDSRIGYCKLPADGNGADAHPSAEGAKKQSATLVSYLQKYLGYSSL